MSEPIILTPSEFVAVFNQTLEFAYPSIIIEGELANAKVSRGRWFYGDIKDAESSIRLFGTVYQLPGPVEDGMMIRVLAQPRLHPNFGFSLNIQSLTPIGEGSIKRAADLLAAKLKAEGLFDLERKRQLPYPPARIALITSSESAAYSDFIKVLNGRWGGLEILLFDVIVQGESAIPDIAKAIAAVNELSSLVDVLVLTRGGGSAEDLAVFNSEMITRAVAASRVPTMVAIGHEKDFSLAELAADSRASTPSNAAQLLVPDRRLEASNLKNTSQLLAEIFSSIHLSSAQSLSNYRKDLMGAVSRLIENNKQLVGAQSKILTALSPTTALKRGFAIIRDARTGSIIRSVSKLRPKQDVQLNLVDGAAEARVKGLLI